MKVDIPTNIYLTNTEFSWTPHNAYFKNTKITNLVILVIELASKIKSNAQSSASLC